MKTIKQMAKSISEKYPTKEEQKAAHEGYMAAHAQFATDAGGEYPEQVIANWHALHLGEDYSNREFTLITKCIKYALCKAPSTHSSSEMVEGWVSVTYRLPEKEKVYITKNQNLAPYIEYKPITFYPNKNYENIHEWQGFYVTHWFELPE